jgi:hypothetical protein
VAADEGATAAGSAKTTHSNSKMELATAKDVIRDLAASHVSGISFTAGEPFIYFDDLLALVDLCHDKRIYTRVVTNSFWAKTEEKADQHLARLKENGLCQLRLSYSRWHQQHVPSENIVNAARACLKSGVDYFVSFVTDFSAEDDAYEQFLRDHGLKYFPEPVIYAGRAEVFGRDQILTDFQENRCGMNPYLAPDLTMYACCDAGTQFNTTDFFKLGTLAEHTARQLLATYENSQLYNCIRSLGISTIASFAGIKARDIVTYRKCDLCKELFDSPETLSLLEAAAASGELQRWRR